MMMSSVQRPLGEAGRQLSLVQAGLDPDHWKPFNGVGAGTKEIIINLDDGWFRVM
jgi:phage-related protein